MKTKARDKYITQNFIDIDLKSLTQFRKKLFLRLILCFKLCLRMTFLAEYADVHKLLDFYWMLQFLVNLLLMIHFYSKCS